MSEAPFHVATRELEAPIAAVWAIIGDFGGLKRWSGAVESCSADGNAVGAMRRVVIAGGEIVERLEAFDPADHTLCYRPVSGSTLPIAGMNVAMQLTPLDEARTRIDWTVFGRPTIDPDKARGSIARRYEFRLDELVACLAGFAAGA